MIRPVIIIVAGSGAWHLLNASPNYLKIVKYTLLIGFYANWIAYLLSGLWSPGLTNFPTAVLIAWAAYKKYKE